MIVGLDRDGVPFRDRRREVRLLRSIGRDGRNERDAKRPRKSHSLSPIASPLNKSFRKDPVRRSVVIQSVFCHF